MKRLFFPALLAAAFVLAVPTPAAAGPGPKIWNQNSGDHGFQLDFHAGFSWYGRGFAGGVRFNIPLVRKGFLSGHNDAFYLSIGVDSYVIRWRDYRDDCGRGYCHDYGFGLGIPIVAHWEFYFFQKFSAFVEAGGNVFFHPGVFRGRGDRDFVDNPRHWIIAAAGVRWKFGRSASFIARIGLPYAAVGISFEF